MTYIDISNIWDKTTDVWMLHNGSWVPVNKFEIKASGLWREPLYDDYLWQTIDSVPNLGNAEVIQSTISTGDELQSVDLEF